MNTSELKDLTTLLEEKKQPPAKKLVNPGQWDYLHNEIETLVSPDSDGLTIDITKPLTQNMTFDLGLLFGSKNISDEQGNSLGRFIFSCAKPINNKHQINLTSILDTSRSVSSYITYTYNKLMDIKYEGQLQKNEHHSSLEAVYRGPWYTLSAKYRGEGMLTCSALTQLTDQLIFGYACNYVNEQNLYINEFKGQYTYKHSNVYGFTYSRLQGLSLNYLNHISKNCAVGGLYAYIPQQQMSLVSLVYSYMFGPKDTLKLQANTQKIISASISRNVSAACNITFSLTANLASLVSFTGISVRFMLNDLPSL